MKWFGIELHLNMVQYFANALHDQQNDSFAYAGFHTCVSTAVLYIPQYVLNLFIISMHWVT